MKKILLSLALLSALIIHAGPMKSGKSPVATTTTPTTQADPTTQPASNSKQARVKKTKGLNNFKKVTVKCAFPANAPEFDEVSIKSCSYNKDSASSKAVVVIATLNGRRAFWGTMKAADNVCSMSKVDEKWLNKRSDKASKDGASGKSMKSQRSKDGSGKSDRPARVGAYQFTITINGTNTGAGLQALIDGQTSTNKIDPKSVAITCAPIVAATTASGK